MKIETKQNQKETKTFLHKKSVLRNVQKFLNS